jgi:UDPglucose 6-dehydrogenase
VQVSIIGSGVVGSATGRGLAKMGKQVTFYDTNPRTLAGLESEGFLVAHSLDEAVDRSQVLVLCLPTPPSPTGYDLSRLYEVAGGIDELIEEHTIILRSTVLPGTTRELSSLLPKEKLVYNPEFLREAYALDDFLNPNRIVIGAQSETAFQVCDELYRGFQAPIIRTDWETAEMGKLVSNSFLASKISFFNEVWLLSKKKGFDTTKIETIAALDARIGLYGTKGGTPFHGACLPKDSEALTVFARASGQTMSMLESTLRVNELVKSSVSPSNEIVKSYVTPPKMLEASVSVHEKPQTLEGNPS